MWPQSVGFGLINSERTKKRRPLRRKLFVPGRQGFYQLSYISSPMNIILKGKETELHEVRH
jgi:hypothetical protein